MYLKNQLQNKKQKGMIALLTLIILFGVAILGTSTLYNAYLGKTISINYNKRIQSFYAADGLMTLITQEFINGRDSIWLKSTPSMGKIDFEYWNKVSEESNSLSPITITKSVSETAMEDTISKSVILNPSVLNFGNNGKPTLIGLSFEDIKIPKNAKILSAYLQFKASTSTSGRLVLKIFGEANPYPAQFKSENGNLSNRIFTDARSPWGPPDWIIGENNSNQKTQNLSTILQELVNHPLWEEESQINFLIPSHPGDLHTNSRNAFSNSIDLEITYTMPEGRPMIENLLADSRFPKYPKGIISLTKEFATPGDYSDEFGGRIQGFIHPPQTGFYTFWISADYQSRLYLSSDQSPENSQLIAGSNKASPKSVWDSYSIQQSRPIWLTAGNKYYIDAIYVDNSSADHMMVGWRLPDLTVEKPIPATRFSNFKSALALGTGVVKIGEFDVQFEIMEKQRGQYNLKTQSFQLSQNSDSLFYIPIKQYLDVGSPEIKFDSTASLKVPYTLYDHISNPRDVACLTCVRNTIDPTWLPELYPWKKKIDYVQFCEPSLGTNPAQDWDFRPCLGEGYGITGLAEKELGLNGVPQFFRHPDKNIGCPGCAFHNKNIDRWFLHNTEKPVPTQVFMDTMELYYLGAGNYQIRYANFYPLTNKSNTHVSNGNEKLLLAKMGSLQNFGFTVHLQRFFEYDTTSASDANFDFIGDDDLFVYIDRKLVLEIGGIHVPWAGSFNLADIGSRLGLKHGKTYPFDFFLAERNPDGSSVKLTTNIKMFEPPKKSQRSWQRDYGTME